MKRDDVTNVLLYDNLTYGVSYHSKFPITSMKRKEREKKGEREEKEGRNRKIFFHKFSRIFLFTLEKKICLFKTDSLLSPSIYSTSVPFQSCVLCMSLQDRDIVRSTEELRYKHLEEKEWKIT